MPSFSSDLFDTETISDQTNQIAEIYTASLTCVFNRQPGNSVLTNFYLTASEPQNSSLYISLPILHSSILSVTLDPQQHQPLDWIGILPIPNQFNLLQCSYICTTIKYTPEAKNGEVIQQFLNKPTPTNQQLKLIHLPLWSRHF